VFPRYICICECRSKWLVSTQDICIETPEVDDTSEESTCANRKKFLTYNFRWVIMTCVL